MKKEATAAVLGVLDRFPVPLVIASPLTAEVLWVNAALLRMAEIRTREEVLGRTLFEFIQADQIGKALADLAKVALKKSPPAFTYYLRKSSGEFAAAQVSSIPMVFGGQLAMLSVVTDVSERERLLVELAESKERYQTLMDNLPVAVAVVVDDRFVFANDALLKLFGASDCHEVVGKSLFDFIDEGEKPTVRKRRRDILREGGVPREERVGLRRLDGSLVEAAVVITRVRWEGLLATQTVIRVHPVNS